MRVHIGGDHAAYDLKCTLVTFLQGKGYDVVDHGPEYFDAQDDYPVAVLRAAQAVPSLRGRTTTHRSCRSVRG
jgi:ribose 5-phosphate isomerase B